MNELINNNGKMIEDIKNIIISRRKNIKLEMILKDNM